MAFSQGCKAWPIVLEPGYWGLKKQLGVEVEMNLNDLSLKELKDLQSQIAKAVASFEDRRKRLALSELEEVARSKGFSLAELTGTPAARKTTASLAKYANPANHADTWSGRGRKPRWFISAMAAGRKPEDLAV